jgi:hypothetical protein
MYFCRFEVNKGAEFLSSSIQSLVLLHFNIAFPLYIIFLLIPCILYRFYHCEKGNDIIVEDVQCSGTVLPSVFWGEISSNSVPSVFQ